MNSQTQTQFLDIYRTMARATADSAKAALQTSERIHQQQLQLVRTALEQNTRAASQLAEARTLDEVLAAQSQFAGLQVAQAMEIWRAMLRHVGDSQMTFLSQMQNQAGQATDTVRQAYDLTARATEDAARTAASQVTAAANTSSAGERRPQEQQHRKSA
jgi:hypothetical protein